MKALSLWQPHALAIAIGLKPWETRDWPTKYRGPLVIHAAKRPWRPHALDPWEASALRKLRMKLFPSVGDVERDASLCLINRALVYGALLCIVDLVDCVGTHELRGNIPKEYEFWGDFSDGDRGGRYAFKLENLRVLPAAVPYRGLQGFFEVDLRGEEFAQRPAAAPSLFEGIEC